MLCQSCLVVAINGVLCHEIGCPDADVDLRTGEKRKKECAWCGSEFVPEERGQIACSEDCAEAYFN